MRKYLLDKCPIGPDGKTKECRIWPTNVIATGESKLWQDALARKRTADDWVIISNPGKGGYEGPLPADETAMLALLKKYGE